MWAWWWFWGYNSGTGEAVCSDTDKGKCWVKFPGEGAKEEGDSNYNIIYTDYNNVSLVYSCSNTWRGKDEVGWVLTRNWDLSEETIDGYEAKFKELVPTWSGSLSKHEQGTNRWPDCKYNPE